MSLSTAPSGFRATREYLLLHTLAFASAKRHFPATELVTDELGLIIADRMRWDYTSFRLDLFHAPPELREIWSSGKLLAQLAQTEPYAHLDNDFILHAALPADLLGARVFVQSKDEPGFYLAPWAQDAMGKAGIHPGTVAYNTGLIGGTDLPALHAYCVEALEAMRVLADHPSPHGIAILAEQAVFGAFVRRHRIKVAEMIPLPLSAVDVDFAGREFTHLWGPTKRDAGLMGRIEKRLMAEFPSEYAGFVRGFDNIEVALTRRKFGYRHSLPYCYPEPSYTSAHALDAIGHAHIAQGPDCAVVLVCHPGYVDFARKAVAAIEGQGFKEKVFVYDKAGLDELHLFVFGEGWKFISEDFRNPNAARNAGLAEIESPWVCFWDADNVMPSAYLTRALATLESAGPQVAVCYPQVQQVLADGTLGHLFESFEWTLPLAQQYSLVDTASFWRTDALLAVGGWALAQVDHDDYELALRLFRCGWQGRRLPVQMQHQSHGANRSSRVTEEDQRRTNESLWTGWSHALVTLWSGNNIDASGDVLDWLDRETLPPQTALYWVDNSDGRMTAELNDWAQLLRDKFVSVTIITPPHSPHDTTKCDNLGPEYLDFERHTHVAGLYNLVLPRLREEIVIMVEDDTVPPIGGLRTLLGWLRPGSNIAVVTSVYRSRNAPTHACMALRKDLWDDCPQMDQLPSEPFEIGMCGGGFGVYANWALQQCLPMTCSYSAAGYLMGWDGNLGLALTARGFKLLAHPGVRADHRCPEVLAYEISLPA